MRHYDQDDSYISAGNMNADITGAAIDCAQLDRVSFHNIYTHGTFNVVGTFEYSGSNDGSDWVPLTIDKEHGAHPNAAAGNHMVVLTDLPRYVRQKFVWTAGTNGTLNTKALGIGQL